MRKEEIGQSTVEDETTTLGGNWEVQSGMECRGLLSILNFVKITEYGWKVVIE